MKLEINNRKKNLENPQICGNQTTLKTPMSQKGKSQGILENILRQMKKYIYIDI